MLINTPTCTEIYYLDFRPDKNLDQGGELQRRVVRTKVSQDELVEILSMGGLRVRFYDKEEKLWMEKSQIGGIEVVRGNRDGSWGTPDLEEYKNEYLRRK